MFRFKGGKLWGAQLSPPMPTDIVYVPHSIFHVLYAYHEVYQTKTKNAPHLGEERKQEVFLFI